MLYLLPASHPPPPSLAARHLLRPSHHQQINASYPALSTFAPRRPDQAWISTGIWAPAGSMLTITLDPQWAADLKAAGKPVYFQIGSHTADLTL